jgi:cytochrome c oxidase subunit 2
MLIYCDIGENFQILFQDPATPYMIGINELHDKINYYLIIIITIVSYFIIIRIISNRGNINIKYLNHSIIIEFIWTIFPAIILIIIAIPSFKLLYALDEIISPEITIKIKGAQWYWNYEISDIENNNINFDSYTLTLDDLEEGQFRLLDVDNRLILPILTPIRLLITAEDVIHSFTIPSFGLKTDAVPGRLNSSSLFLLREGVFYGQCSELCGKSHYNMSIVIEGVKKETSLNWLSEMIS